MISTPSQDCCVSGDFCTSIGMNLGMESMIYIHQAQECLCAEKEKGSVHVSQQHSYKSGHRSQWFL